MYLKFGNFETRIELKRVLAVLIWILLTIGLTKSLTDGQTEWNLVDTTINENIKIVTYEKVPVEDSTILLWGLISAISSAIIEYAFYSILKSSFNWFQGGSFT